MNGDVARLEKRIDSLREDLSAARLAIWTRIWELEDKFKQEETDREHADTSLEDRIADLEAGE